MSSTPTNMSIASALSGLYDDHFSRINWFTSLVFLAMCTVVTNLYATPTEKTKLASPTASELKAVARLLNGRLIVGGGTFYRLSTVHSLDQSEGVATLHAEVDPLFNGEYSGNPDGSDNGRLYYNVRLAPNAACGLPGVSTSLDTSNFLVFHEGVFVTLNEAFKEVLSQTPVQSWDRPINRITPEILQKLELCAKQIAEIADAMPFRKIGVYVTNQLITEVARTTAKSWTYEESPGEELIGKITHLVISPKHAGTLNDFKVQVRAVSVMHCDYEGPHIELDGWKQGLGPAIQLKQAGNKFIVTPAIFNSQAPAFPAYTRTELRRAIAIHFGNAGLASKEEAKPCAPFLRGYRFSVHYRSQLVQDIFLAYAGGC